MRSLGPSSLLFCVLASDASARRPPHLVFILADDTGWANVGYHSNNMHTPNIDRLAREEGAELSAMYAYKYCSPSRASLMSGRLPYHVNQYNYAEWGWDSSPIHPSMKLLPEKLQEAGYFTVQVGKWHLGLSKQAYTPAGRGFNESLTMLMGSEDHFTQRNGVGHHVDLWATDRPAKGQNGTYSAELFGDHAVQAIIEQHKHRPSMPLFMFLAFTVTHTPIQAPQRFLDLYPKSWVEGRRTYAAMASAMDEEVGKVIAALKSTGMWNDTLLLFSSDNGGPSLEKGPSYANNFPLRGGKGNSFEGGVRVCAAVSGGLLPKSQWGRQLPERGHIHFSDVYSTFCKLAGHSACKDSPNNAPSLDSFDMWPMLSGRTDASPRTETLLEYGQYDATLLSGDWKLILGRQDGSGYWWGPEYPNSTAKPDMTEPGCPHGCLFNVTADPTEHVDLSEDFPEVKASLTSRLGVLGKTVFQSDQGGKMDLEGAEAAAKGEDWWCPWLDGASVLLV